MNRVLSPSIDVEKSTKMYKLRTAAQQRLNTKLLIGAIALFVAFILFIYVRNKIVKQQLIDLKNPTIVNVPVPVPVQERTG